MRCRMNTLVVVLSECVIWYEYGMHPKPVETRKERGRRRDSSDDDDVDVDGMDPFSPGGISGKETGGFWLVKKKEWKTAYNPDG